MYTYYQRDSPYSPNKPQMPMYIGFGVGEYL